MAEQSRMYVYDAAKPTGWKPWDGSGSGGGSGGVTQAEVQAAIEAATNLNDVETSLATIATNTADAETLIGAVTETAPASDTASSGLNGRLQRIAQRITSLIALLPSSLGQKTKTGSLAVTLASDQDALPITDNSGSLTIDSTQLPASLGTKTAVNSFPVTLSSDGTFATAFGTATDASASSDTANTGFISLFKRLLSVTLLKGTQTAANSIAVTLASDGVAVTRLGANGDAASLTGSQSAQLREIGNRLINTTTTYTHPTPVSVTNASTQVVAANSSRKHLIIVNRSTTLCYLQFGATATTNGIPLNPATISGQGGGTYEMTYSNLFTGAINAITSSGTATLSVMEGV